MYLTIIAKFKLNKDSTEYVRSELLKMVEPTYKEKGYIDYIFYQDKDDPTILFVYENWESKEDLDAHMNSEHFKNCFEKIVGLYEIEVHHLTKL